MTLQTKGGWSWKRVFSGIFSAIFIVTLAGNIFAAVSAEGEEKLLRLGSPAPYFRLQEVVSGKMISLDDYEGAKAFLVVVLCGHCPFVKHIQKGLREFEKDYYEKDFAMVAISANDPARYEEDSPAKLKDMAEKFGYGFPILYDESGNTARALTAVATPDFFLFDKDRKLVYRGQFDDSRPRSGIPVTGKDVRAAVDAVLEDRQVPLDQKPAVGCSIKWKPEPKRPQGVQGVEL